MSHFLIVGQKFFSLADYLNNNGHSYTLLKDILKTKNPDKKIKNREVADFSSKKDLFEKVDLINHSNHIDGVLTTYENYVLPAAWIAEHLNLPGLPIKSAEACSDKFLMRSLFAKAPEPISPDFTEVSSLESLKEFADNHEFPLILKPANLVKSLLVTKSYNQSELINNYHKSIELLNSTYQKYAPNREPKLIIEEYLDGSIHSVDAFVDRNGEPKVLEQIVDYQTGYDIGYDDNFHYSRLIPTKLSSEDQNKLRHCAEIGIRSLGMKNSPAHVEIIMTKNGPRIVEIGARNGGYRERMHKLSNNIDITGAALSISLGNKPNITASKNEPCAVLELFPKVPGKFVGITNQKELESLSSLNYLSIKVKEGDYIGKSSDGYKMTAVVILHNSNLEKFNNDLDYLNNNCFVKTN